MRGIWLGLAMAGMVAAGSAAAQQCVRPEERAAFDAAGLKSQLMITALTCDARDKYNAFVQRFRADLMSHERALRGYFIRNYGPRGQQRHDDYITSLANAQSQSGLKDGTLFCARNAALLDEVLALPKGIPLGAYASGKPRTQPVDFEPCPPSRPATRTAEARGGR